MLIITLCDLVDVLDDADDDEERNVDETPPAPVFELLGHVEFVSRFGICIIDGLLVRDKVPVLVVDYHVAVITDSQFLVIVINFYIIAAPDLTIC